MKRYIRLLLLFAALCVYAEDAPAIKIGEHQVSYPAGWVVVKGQDVLARKFKGKQVIGELYGSNLRKSAKVESDEMADIQGDAASIMKLTEHSTFDAFNGKKGIRVFVDLAVTAENMNGTISFYSWYIDLGDKAYTVKLKCPTALAKELAKDVEAVLAKQ